MIKMTCETLTPEEIEVIRVQIAEAELALHKLRIGGGVAAFQDQNGERVEYRATNIYGLISHINSLRLRIGMCPMQGVVSRPAGVIL